MRLRIQLKLSASENMKSSIQKFFFLTLFLSAAALFSAQSINAQSGPYTPDKGSTERKAILDGVRKYRKAPAEVYSPTGFKVQNGWAFVSAPDPSDPEVDTMAFQVLLQKSGKSWRVVDHVNNVEGTDFQKEIRRIRKKFPRTPGGIFE